MFLPFKEVKYPTKPEMEHHLQKCKKVENMDSFPGKRFTSPSRKTWDLPVNFGHVLLWTNFQTFDGHGFFSIGLLAIHRKVFYLNFAPEDSSILRLILLWNSVSQAKLVAIWQWSRFDNQNFTSFKLMASEWTHDIHDPLYKKLEVTSTAVWSFQVQVAKNRRIMGLYIPSRFREGVNAPWDAAKKERLV